MHRTSSDHENARLRRELAQAVRAVCSSRYADRADDLVQTAMLRLLRLRERGEGPATPSPSYLRRVAYNALVDELRRPHRRREAPLDPTVVTVQADAPDPEHRAAGAELGEAIRRCLEQLIDSRRTAVSLSLLGHTVSETARLLSWGRKRTENLVLRGRKDLRRCLEESGWKP